MSIAAAETSVVACRASRRGARAARPRRKTQATLIWVCVLLLTAEGGVRIRAWHRHGTRGPVADIYEPHDLLGRRPRPGAVLQGRFRNLTINRWGFRGRDIEKEKPPGRTRIAAIGDSATFGMEAGSDDAVWGAQMVGLLEDRLGGGRYDFINGGVPGYTLAASTIQLTDQIAPFNPDIVIVYQVGTDIAAHARRQFAPVGPQSNTSSVMARLVQENSLLVHLIRVNAAAFSSKRLPQRRHDRLDDRGIEAYTERLMKVIKIGEEHDWRMIVCTCPRAFGDETAPTDQYRLAGSALAHNPALSLAGLNDAFDRYNDAVRRVASDMGVPLVDLDLLVPKRRAYFADALHLNDAGHRLVGEVIADVVMGIEPGGSLARKQP